MKLYFSRNKKKDNDGNENDAPQLQYIEVAGFLEKCPKFRGIHFDAQSSNIVSSISSKYNVLRRPSILQDTTDSETFEEAV